MSVGRLADPSACPCVHTRVCACVRACVRASARPCILLLDLFREICDVVGIRTDIPLNIPQRLEEQLICDSHCLVDFGNCDLQRRNLLLCPVQQLRCLCVALHWSTARGISLHLSCEYTRALTCMDKGVHACGMHMGSTWTCTHGHVHMDRDTNEHACEGHTHARTDGRTDARKGMHARVVFGLGLGLGGSHAATRAFISACSRLSRTCSPDIGHGQ